MIKTIPLIITNLEQDGFHPLVKCKLKKKTIWLVVDTGASRTVIDLESLNDFSPFESEHIEPFAAGINAQQFAVKRYILPNISFSGIKFKNMEVFGSNLSELSKLYEQLAGMPIHGLLGCDFLVKHKVVLNFKTKELLFKVKTD
jgi:predicted aspartyl protease